VRSGDGCGRVVVAELVVGGEGRDGADLAGGGIGQLDEVGDARARRQAAGAVDGLEAPGGAGGVRLISQELGQLGQGEGAGVGVIAWPACAARVWRTSQAGGRAGAWAWKAW